ncbi:MAG: phosphatidylserine decarboxylase [Candidatus Raymondbacteria bacterium RifOxyC12_full_50_8]|uniref:Phosphatidylserine decarboxylase n=1 Tax=Candidatus Raymondbacteria bacterium RIFOXYD12_FULL_49_13 TaxID=1817890 RepID=A0A1F7FIM1_UNCRA|nr:MAG: phosphatidylserine decarboxylase [Candidatus Raymondbacteria bacterium RIFOXYA2_FULL_49_16]OGJ95683.1 MAG: phosphatidylserine decarboxylase [Candidatus Raymondbacteria bacterium RifOxyB12_full_50_8]OGK05954.1 MAG: phosphatidylserine decarboxylase [Candidatus Raymondbacteria bacterium RifOxyC12_full_50_8]OGK06312.1 MAG: phosphatidylserine decarboxylase [Candidatus Raymondbacteria bacterium RIFOXYD12_FULL_49_13]OGP40645.1 MAG: phosphatidylserine decarboxylase [Candidatus Raymondbacteria b
MAKEGLPILAVVLLIFLAFLFLFLKTESTVVSGFMILSGIFTLFTLFFFRDPERNIPREGQNVLVSAADGKIVEIKEIDCEYLGGKARQISTFLSVFNVHVNRIPEKGTIELYKYYPGKFLAAWDHKASLENEQTHVGINCGTYKILVKQIAGLIARRVICKAREGVVYNRGDRFGLIRFGSRTDVICPLDFTVKVKIGDVVKGGESILAIKETP